MTVIALRGAQAEPREPVARKPADRGDAPPSFRDELAQTTEGPTPERGRTTIKRVTIPVGDPMVAVATGTVPTPNVPSPDGPGIPLVAAGIGAAIGTPSVGLAPIAPPAAATPVAPPLAAQVATLTPLEQAVQALLEQLQPASAPGDDEDEPASALELPFDPGATTAGPGAARIASDGHRAHAVAPAAATPAPEPATEPLANPSHVHLVMDDGDERVVVTVAVRGNEVRVAMRAGDDATVAALARNAGSLDHALRARGLDLTEFTPPDRERERSDHQPHDPPPKHSHPRFRLEENA